MTRVSLIVLAAAGCDVLPAPDWEQMIDQHKLKAYEASPYFSDGRGLRTPPSGTIARGDALAPVTLSLDRAALERGRRLFETDCAVCHGVDGSGESEVARRMEERRPPSLLTAPVPDFPPERIFDVISDGYGLMPSYRQGLSPVERWEVVGYLRALQLSRAAHLDALPPAVRATIEHELHGAEP